MSDCHTASQLSVQSTAYYNKNFTTDSQNLIMTKYYEHTSFNIFAIVRGSGQWMLFFKQTSSRVFLGSGNFNSMGSCLSNSVLTLNRIGNNFLIT